jgi:hypothetical protein
MGAISVFVTLAWKDHGAWPLLVVALGMGTLAWALTRHFAERERQPLPAGLMAALCVVAVPMAVFSAQYMLGQWDSGRNYRDYHLYIDGRWLFIELATLAAGAVVLWRFKLPFSTLPIAITLWYMSMDLAPFLAGSPDTDWATRKWVSLWFGLGMMLFALYLDWRSGEEDRDPAVAVQDFGYWIALFGVIAFWGGLSGMRSDTELGKFIYALINIGLLLASVVFKRGVLAVFGGIGLSIYLGHLSYRVFRDSLLFPVALAALGIAVVFAGLWWHRNQARMAALFGGFLPRRMQRAIDQRS